MRNLATWALCAAMSSPAWAGDWTPDARGPGRLMDDIRRASRELGGLPVRGGPVAAGDACHTMKDAARYSLTVEDRKVSVRSQDASFAKSLSPKIISGGEREPWRVEDAYGGHWLESAWTREIVALGGKRPEGAVSLEPMHTGYLLRWPGELSDGTCGGGEPEVSLLAGPKALEWAERLIEKEEAARRGRRGRPTAKPFSDEPPPIKS